MKNVRINHTSIATECDFSGYALGDLSRERRHFNTVTLIIMDNKKLWSSRMLDRGLKWDHKRRLILEVDEATVTGSRPIFRGAVGAGLCVRLWVGVVRAPPRQICKHLKFRDIST